MAPAPPVPLFADPQVQASLESDGYAIVDLLEAADIARVIDVLADLGPAPGDPRDALFNDTWSTDPTYKATMSRRLHEVFDGAARAAFSGHRNLAWTGITKWPGPRGAVVPHRDPSFVDERRHRSIGIWCALEPLDTQRAALQVAPGSHRDAPPIRVHQSPDNLHPDVVGETVPLGPGQALVYDHALVHGSPPHRTDGPRTVIAGLMVPDGAEAVYTLATSADEAATVSIDETFFLEHRLDALDVDAVLARRTVVARWRRSADGSWSAAPLTRRRRASRRWAALRLR